MRPSHKTLFAFTVYLFLCMCAGGRDQAAYAKYPHRGLYELSVESDRLERNPYADVEFRIEFTRPNGKTTVTEGYYDGGRTFRGRAYCDTLGRWTWQSSSSCKSLDGRRGSFQVVPSDLPGKLRLHANDSRQFAYDSGQWFIHIGDTGYRYVTATEPEWKEYIDQAVRMGATKIRTWFCQGRSDVQVLFSDDRTKLNLAYWQEIDRRLLYALEEHPHVILKLIPYGEDTVELRRYGRGNEMSRLIARYAQARFSALPNIHWCISNDREIIHDGQPKGRQVRWSTIDCIGRHMAAREPWGTLLTNHQSRFKGYDFVDAPWSDIITLEDIDQVDGRIFKQYYDRRACPMVLDEDRYEHWRNPEHDRYFFRRLMWASLLSGGHATYGGLRTYEPYDGRTRGVQGYYDAVEAGKLEHGADDFIHIHAFFDQSELTLVGMKPDDKLVGNKPGRFKCIRDDETCIVYLANPNHPESEQANVDKDIPAVTVGLPTRGFAVKWFNPRTGEWIRDKVVTGDKSHFEAPGPGDWILLLQRQ